MDYGVFQMDELKEQIHALLGGIQEKQRTVIERYLFELSAVYQLAREISTCADLDNCLKIVAERIAQLFSVETVSIVLKEEHSDILKIRCARGLSEEIVENTIIEEEDPPKTIIHWVIKTGKPLLVEDLVRDGRFPIRRGRYYNNSLLSVPLKEKEKVIGVININNKTSREVFNLNDLSLLTKIGELLSVYLESITEHRKKTIPNVKEEIVSHLSHEFKVPVTVIDEVLEMLVEELNPTLNDRQKRLFALARQSTQRLKRFVEDWLTYAKNGGNKKVAIEGKFFDLVSTVKHVIYSLDILAVNKGVVIKGLFPHSAELKIWANEDEITQVLVNLIHNAVKYNKENGTVEVSFEVSENKDLVKIYVSDTGIGISPENREKIFQRYNSAAGFNGDNVDSHGLGLYISREIIRRHGGEINVVSEVGKGSTFIVSLPQKKQIEG
ncbi:MAG: GAF domain-containing sensor histidine kinase [Candidatus Omnitrophica bacterium]|nr:GAF domain-containing sensor histidine kinase [Candidatus Omnitrophota bacterium]